MAMLISPDSELGKELAKWNKPYRYEAYPRMVYRAKKRPDGRVSVGETDDRLFEGRPGAADRPGAAELFTSSCQMIVGNEMEHQRAKENGWRDTQAEALEAFEAKERAIGDAAAHRAYEDRNLSEKAKEEVELVEAASFEHVPEIPAKPKRGRPRKVA